MKTGTSPPNQGLTNASVPQWELVTPSEYHLLSPEIISSLFYPFPHCQGWLLVSWPFHKDRADPEVLPVCSQLCLIHPSSPHPPPISVWTLLITSSTFSCSLCHSWPGSGVHTPPRWACRRKQGFPNFCNLCLPGKPGTAASWRALYDQKKGSLFLLLMAGCSQSVHPVKQHLKKTKTSTENKTQGQMGHLVSFLIISPTCWPDLLKLYPNRTQSLPERRVTNHFLFNSLQHVLSSSPQGRGFLIS